jgi:hypothetical protein
MSSDGPIFGKFHTVRVIESEYMVDTETVTVRRSWRERLFSLPWRPLTATKQETRTTPRPSALQLRNGDLIVHPHFAKILSELFAKEPQA